MKITLKVFIPPAKVKETNYVQDLLTILAQLLQNDNNVDVAVLEIEGRPTSNE